jgi:hypothetical protein
MENNAFDYNSLAQTIMDSCKLPWNPGWLLPEEPKFNNFNKMMTARRAVIFVFEECLAPGRGGCPVLVEERTFDSISSESQGQCSLR